MINTYVFTKKPQETFVCRLDNAVAVGGSLPTVEIGSFTPANNAPTIFSTPTIEGTTLIISVNGGDDRFAYGASVTLTYPQLPNPLVVSFTLVINVVADSFNPYLNESPDSYQDLIGDLVVGKSALGSVYFVVPRNSSTEKAAVTWELLDKDGILYGSGNAYYCQTKTTGNQKIVEAKSVITVPSSAPVSLNESYQIRYKLLIGDQPFYIYESLRVLSASSVQVGTQDSIELAGDQATMSLVTASIFQNYEMEVYGDNTKIASVTLNNPEKISNGYYVGGVLPTAGMHASLSPLSIIFKYWNNQAQTFRETAKLWIVNPSILQAIDDVKSKVNKARQTLYGTEDSQFPSTEILKWLRRGADLFNGSYGVFTSFTFTNAKGPVREFWLLYAELMALRSQYLLEGEKAFNFSGSAISLDVDRTSFFDSAASTIQSQLDSEFKAFKQNLVIKGNTGGDGSGPYGNGDFNVSSAGALAGIAISITPASIYSTTGFGYAGPRT